MRSHFRILNNHARLMLRGTTVLAGIGAAFIVMAPAFAADDDSTVETVVVTGYRASLTAATDAKRASTNFTDSIFAEDIGKFPDTNIAESLNRIPGVTIGRDNDGEGVNVSIRGLGTNFTKILLNGAPIAIASTGAVDQSNNNREVDLNMFPTELFTQLTVAKTSTADLVEGGAAGTVTLRSARPFDKEGFRVTYSAQGSDYSKADGLGERGSLIISDTWGDEFGALVGLAGVHNNVMTTGFEDGNSGWQTLGPLSAAQCGAGNTCDAIDNGSNVNTIPGVVPAGISRPASGGIPAVNPGDVVDAAWLTAHNPGLTTAQISTALIPRLPREMYEQGTRDRYNGIASFEWRPSDNFHAYLDMIGGRTDNNLDRSDLDFGFRSGNGSQPVLPVGLTVDSNGVTTGGSFLDSQFFLEARPYKEHGDFYSFNPGFTWHAMDMLDVDVQANYSRSVFHRDSPSFFLVTTPSTAVPAGVPTGAPPPAGGVVATFTNPLGQAVPTISSNFDLDNPANYQWDNGRVNLQDERRVTFTKGVRANVKYGSDAFSVKVGAAYDDIYRQIKAVDASAVWQDAICGGNPSVFLPPTNSAPACYGLSATGSAAAVNATTPGLPISNGAASPYPGHPLPAPLYPGYGTGYSTGFAPITYGGSLVPQSAVASYLRPGPTGFVAINYDAIKKASMYNQIDQMAQAAFNNSNTYPFSTSSNSGGNSGQIEEKDTGVYAQVDGVLHVEHDLRYDFGLRWVQTEEAITSPITHVDPRNATLSDGGLYPNTYTFATATHTYGAFLPSLNLAYNFADDLVLRASLSRTMTRPNPNSMVSGINFSSPDASTASLGNPNLKPYYSNNIDLGAEYYTGGEGYFGVAIFRKGVSGFTQSKTVAQPFSYLSQFGITYNTLTASQQTALATKGCVSDAVCPVLVQVSSQVNIQGLLTINGMEFDYVQPLDFLLEPYGLKGFGFNGNVTILDQKSSGAVPAFATGVAPLSYNVTGYYENEGAMLRLSYVWNDKSYASGSGTAGVCLPSAAAAASGCPGGAYLFSAPYGELDLSSSLKLARLFGDLPSDPELTFDIQNVTKAKLKVYDQYPNALHSYYDQGQIILFGLRGTF
ncbi:MAG: TonB-dependent receptor [Rhizomicrobium sp.]